jgi:SAM-dependent methyltransferase
MNIQELIAALVPGRSFADLGGLWGTVNERITPAVLAGAASATMIDEQPAGNYLWQAFDEHCAKLNVSGYASIEGNLDDPDLPRRVGQFDVLHCSGVIYHCPDPYHSLRQMRRLTRRHLLLGSMTVPERVQNAAGTLDFSEGRMLALPALKGGALAIMRQHFDDLHIKVHNINVDEPFPWTMPDGITPSYAPWWWLFTAETLAAMAEAVGLRVLDTFDAWPGYAHYLRCEVPN